MYSRCNVRLFVVTFFEILLFKKKITKRNKNDHKTHLLFDETIIMKNKKKFVFCFGLNSIYSVIINTIVNIYTMLCKTGSDSKHKAYI